MNIELTNVSASALRRAADIKAQIEQLDHELHQLLGLDGGSYSGNGRISATGRANIAAAARARWAKFRSSKPAASKPSTGRKMTAAAKARLAAIARARWKKAKASGRNAL